MTHRLRAATGALALVLTPTLFITINGCTVGPNYEAPHPDVPSQFSEIDPLFGAPPPTSMPASLATTQPGALSTVSTQNAPMVEWWRTFGDQELDSLVARALQSNLDLKQATLRVAEARAQRIVTGSAQYPTFEANGTFEHARISKNGIPIPGVGAPSGGGPTITPNLARPNATSGSGSSGSSSGSSLNDLFPSEINLYQAGFDASYELDLFGGVRRRVEAANADVQATEADRQTVMVSLLSEVARNYMDIRGLQRQLGIVQDNLNTQQQTLKLTQERFRGGVVSELDVARAASQVASTSARIPDLYNQIRMATHRLAVLLGQQPMTLVTELARTAPLPPVPPQVPIGLPSELLRRRPDIIRAERQLAAQNARIGVATADLFPRIALNGNIELQSLTPRHFFEISSLAASYGPQFSWPIFNAGKIRANVHLQSLREQEFLANYQKTVLTALQEVEDALVSYSTTQLQHRSLLDAVNADKRVVEVATQQYHQGTIDFLTVLDAERSLFASQEALAQNETNVNTSLIALYKALGGGWQLDQQPR